jgi:hypothetical protein
MAQRDFRPSGSPKANPHKKCLLQALRELNGLEIPKRRYRFKLRANL